jgi:hypothetical protein
MITSDYVLSRIIEYVFMIAGDLPQAKLISSCRTERRRTGLIQQLDGLTIQV